MRFPRKIGFATLTALLMLGCGTSHLGLKLADVNGDKHLDALVVDNDNDLLRVLLGNGDGTFQPSLPFQIEPYGSATAVGDLDGQHGLDTVVATDHRLSVFLHNGSEALYPDSGELLEVASPPLPEATASGLQGVLAVDVDGEHRADLVTANGEFASVSILRNRGDGTFEEPVVVTVGGSRVSGLAAAPLAGGELPDVVVTDEFENTLKVLRNDGTGQFTLVDPPLATGNEPHSLTIAKLGRETLPSIIVANAQDSTVTIYRNKGAYQFVADPPVPTTGRTAAAVEVGDLDLDGNPDLLIGHVQSGDFVVLPGKADGTFAPAVQLPGLGPCTLAIGDLNEDGKPDLAGFLGSVAVLLHE
jgi:hypothetical protein